MNKTLIALLLVSNTAFAWDDPVIGEPYLSSNDGYETQTGTRYQYDLSRPVDQIKYDIDVRAQIRDDTSVSVTRDIDRGLGQRGGGIFD